MPNRTTERMMANFLFSAAFLREGMSFNLIRILVLRMITYANTYFCTHATVVAWWWLVGRSVDLLCISCGMQSPLTTPSIQEIYIKSCIGIEENPAYN